MSRWAAGFRSDVCARIGRAEPTRWGVSRMRNILRALIAAWGAKKLGGGCITTILLFLLFYWLLGKIL